MNDRASISTKSSSRTRSSEPALGQTEFADWYDTPVFESDADERLEELASSGRGPTRLAAAALLSVQARADRLRGRRALPEPTAAPPANVAPTAPKVEPKVEPKAESKPAPKAKPKVESQPKVEPKAESKPAPKAKPKVESQPKVEPKVEPKAKPKPAPKAKAQPQPKPVLVESAKASPSPIAELDQERRPAAVMLRRPIAKVATTRAALSRAIDRWADREVAIGMRIEEAIPRRLKRR